MWDERDEKGEEKRERKRGRRKRGRSKGCRVTGGKMEPAEPHVKVKVAQSCLTVCDSRNYAVQGLLQARMLEWITFL